MQAAAPLAVGAMILALAACSSGGSGPPSAGAPVSTTGAPVASTSHAGARSSPTSAAPYTGKPTCKSLVGKPVSLAVDSDDEVICSLSDNPVNDRAVPTFLSCPGSRTKDFVVFDNLFADASQGDDDAYYFGQLTGVLHTHPRDDTSTTASTEKIACRPA